MSYNAYDSQFILAHSVKQLDPYNISLYTRFPWPDNARFGFNIYYIIFPAIYLPVYS